MHAAALIADRFVLERPVGAGGMGTVYRAVDRASGAPVALKIATVDDAHHRARALAEADALARLEHPAIVRLVAHRLAPDGRPFLAMEWLEGEDLARRLEALRAIVGPRGGRADSLADGGLVASWVDPGAPRDLATRAARAALLARRRLPSADMALACGMTELRGALPLGPALERAAALLDADEALADGVPVDDVTASLLDGRFEIAAAGAGHRLVAERALDEEEVRLLRLRGDVEVWMASADELGAGSPFALLGGLLQRAAGVGAGDLVEHRQRRVVLSEMLAALAGVRLAQGDAADALTIAREVLDLGARSSAVARLQALTVEAEARIAAGDRAAARARIAEARAEILAIADRIEDEGLRASFLTRGPLCAPLLRLAEAEGAGAATG